MHMPKPSVWGTLVGATKLYSDIVAWCVCVRACVRACVRVCVCDHRGQFTFFDVAEQAV